jgi:hypothetical protein
VFSRFVRQANERPGGGQPQGGGGLAAMMRQIQQQRAQQGGAGARPSGFAAMMQRMQQQRAQPPGGGGGVAPGNAGTLGGPGYGEYPLGSAGPRMDPSDPRYRAPPPPGGGGFQFGKPMPGPGMMPPGGGPGGPPPTETIMPVGGPRVPPNQRGYLQKRAMMNRSPANVGGGANRVGMQDQQGALSRAMQRGTGRAPPSRRFGRGRAGSGRGFQQP